MITTENIVEQLKTDSLIIQSYAYSKKNGRFWVIVEPLTIKLSNEHIISVHKGFYYDMATIPPFIWSVIKPYDDALIAYLIHDYLYIYQEKHDLTRSEADREMLIWANITNKNKLNNYVRYLFVRLFGWLWWKKFI